MAYIGSYSYIKCPSSLHLSTNSLGFKYIIALITNDRMDPFKVWHRSYDTWYLRQRHRYYQPFNMSFVYKTWVSLPILMVTYLKSTSCVFIFAQPKHYTGCSTVCTEQYKI